MVEYDSEYKTGRTILVIIEAIGWAIVVAGIVIAVYVFSSGLEEAAGEQAAAYKALEDRMLGGAQTSLGGVPVPPPTDRSVLLRLFDILPGLVISFSGLLSVAMTQVWRSQLHTAEYAREILQIVRKDASGQAKIYELIES